MPLLQSANAVQEVLQKLKLRSSKQSAEEQKVAKDKEEIYRHLAETIVKDVPVAELGNLILWISKYQESFEQVTNFHETFDTFHHDGAFAFYKALQEKFGFVNHDHGGYGFFGPKPPAFISVPVGPNETVKVPWGGFSLPGYEGLQLVVGTHMVNDGFHFCISGSVKKKDREIVDSLIEMTRYNLKHHSVFKGKAISLRLDEDFNPETTSPDDMAPEFLDLSNINQNELVLPDALMRQVQDNLFTPVEKTDLCRRFGIPLRRGVLLSGTYGIGKTLTAHIQAKKATANGWTFIYLKNVENLAEGLRVARQYAPSVVFAEDIDSLMEGEERDEQMNDVLNTIDGIELKGKEVMVVLTTNYVEDITPAMLRPGRIDALIELVPPDAKAAEKLLKVYGKELINQKSDLSAVGKILSGQRPAMIAETVQRSKLSAITRMDPSETNLSIEASDLESAALTMKHHTELVDGTEEEEPTEEAKIGSAFIQTVADAVVTKAAQSKQVQAG